MFQETGAAASQGRASAEIFAEGNNANSSELPVRQHRVISGHDDVRVCRKCAFQDSIVRFVGENLDRLRRFDEVPEFGEKYRNACERLSIMGELSGEDGEELVNDGARKGERVLAPDDLAERFISSPAGKCESRYQYVGVEDDSHARRYRRRSFSVRTPSSFARRLQ